MQGLKAEIESHESEIDKLVDHAGILSQTSHDVRLNTYTAQTRSRYQTLLNTTKVQGILRQDRTYKFKLINHITNIIEKKITMLDKIIILSENVRGMIRYQRNLPD